MSTLTVLLAVYAVWSTWYAYDLWKRCELWKTYYFLLYDRLERVGREHLVKRR